MPAVFTPCYGAVEVVPNCGGEKVFEITFDGGKVDGIVTGMSLEMSGNYQFLHTVNDFVYFYAFGDRMGQLTVSGIGFVKTCVQSGQKGSLINLYKWYVANRAVRSGGKSVIVRIIDNTGYATFYGFLTGARIDVNDSAAGFIGNWSLRFEVLPKD